MVNVLTDEIPAAVKGKLPHVAELVFPFPGLCPWSRRVQIARRALRVDCWGIEREKRGVIPWP
jgi:hypothetical protein